MDTAKMELPRMLTVLVFLSGLAFASTVRGEVHYMDFVLKEKNFTRLCKTKSMLVVNGTFPGPVIRVRRGDTVFVNVHNHGTYGLTIHWHGVMQPRNPWSDGPEYVTQCQIRQGTNFTYEVQFTIEEGTVWWHAHSDWTRATVHGMIVVYPAEGTTYPFPEPDGEELFILGSWYEKDVMYLVNGLKYGVVTVSDAYTINGQPGDFCACSKNSTYHWYVDYGKTYHIRLLNAGMNAELFVAIADHNLTIVGMDGAYLKPFVTSYVVISPGGTIDALVTANQSLGTYYVIARQYYGGKLSNTGFDKTNASAIMQYNGNYTLPDSPIFPTMPFYYSLNSADRYLESLRSLNDKNHPIDVPMNITTRMFITASLNEVDDSGSVLAASMNNISWTNQPIDVLQAYYKNLSGWYTPDFPDQPSMYWNFTGDIFPFNVSTPIFATKVKVLNYGEEVETVFQDTNVFNASNDHPMHLHGYTFYVVGLGSGNFYESDVENFNLVDPPQLNTIMVPKNGWAAIRFKATNPGVWLFHCHLDRHLTWGMNYVIIVKNGGTPETSMRDPPPNMPFCELPPTIELYNSTETSHTSLEKNGGVEPEITRTNFRMIDALSHSIRYQFGPNLLGNNVPSVDKLPYEQCIRRVYANTAWKNWKFGYDAWRYFFYV